ncbi:hypothetical protein [Mammaliicoccus sciuri]|uniref:hypothetical protein n=1 Tax=Mammaliicoccus sciuri TaxID=1296 RepID=UPI00194EF543|nr:hypothetical protein [Mammaliicoccus sciuri]MEB6096059.1 hypothetical protein [Mammaliicoccus sciuri]MEB8129143.1 hypothetical protein [Mammaliicoccus sciuri]
MYKFNGNIYIKEGKVYFYHFEKKTLEIKVEEIEKFKLIIKSINQDIPATKIATLVDMSVDDINKFISQLESYEIIKKYEEIEKINLLICNDLLHSDYYEKYFQNYNTEVINASKVINNNANINILIADVDNFNDLEFINNRNLYPILVENSNVLFGPLISVDGGPCLKCFKAHMSNSCNMNIINSETLSTLLIFIVDSVIKKIQKKKPFISFDHQVKFNIDDLKIEKKYINRLSNCERCDAYE